MGTISAVGTSSTSGPAANISLVSSTLGNLWVLGLSDITSGSTVTGLSGGGVATWTKLITGTHASPTALVTLWFGKVTSTGTATATFTGTNIAAVDVIAQQFSSTIGASTVWAADGAGNTSFTSSSATITWPSITPAAAGELYVGYSSLANTGLTTGATSGYTVELDRDTNSFIYNPSTSSGAQAPTSSQNTAGTSFCAAGFITATAAASSSLPQPVFVPPAQAVTRSYFW